MMDWRELWMVTFEQTPPTYHLHPILGSLLYYTATFLIASSLRRLNKAASPRRLQEFIADFISTFQTCAVSFENGNSLRLYGWLGLYLVIFTLMMCYARIFTDSCANPVGNAKKYFQHRQSLMKTLLKLVLQAFSGYCAFQYVKHFWSLDFHEYHSIRLQQKQCYTYLSVSVLLGFLIEGGATMTDVVLQSHRFVPWKGLNNVLTCSLLTGLIVSGLSLTGMFFHPAMASSQNFGCKGTTRWEHIVVYWLGPFVGCFLGVKLNSLIKKATEIPGSTRKSKIVGHKQEKRESSRKMNGTGTCNSSIDSHRKSKGQTAVRKRVANSNSVTQMRSTSIKRNE
ncbi:aquaporin-11-like [Liolophura sinensis]|uniref:aquaporin-11-like n=1 Tax=Liolophura sinensis TaxID=3198878 RepID=UPI0031582A03